ncbi:ABC transporter ATP-binding protein [Marivita sp. S0852]|uniref:ABC transporter ATP-binding protein n=1 Tax=Marivita sp. S0852 TaxID=3373893 RepID=UPI00398298ED
MTALKIENLAYAWPGAGGPTLAIDALVLEPGESVFLYGPSGCGKSTLLSAIAGVVDIAPGAIRVMGQDVGELKGGTRDRFRADHIGIIFQMFNLIPWLSALENVVLPCTFSARRRDLANMPTAGAAQRLLSELGLAEPALMAQPSRTLSVGQQQRVAAARAMIGGPNLILADEPTAALDDDTKTGFVHLLTREARSAGAALLFVSHDRSLEGHFDRSVDFRELNAGLR